jgi:hypothetical protein
VRGKRRYLELVRARQVISHLSVKYSSQHKAADILGGNRNNIQFGKTKCALLMETEPLLRREVAEIEQRLEAPFAQIDADFEEELKRQTINETKDEKTIDCKQGTT